MKEILGIKHEHQVETRMNSELNVCVIISQIASKKALWEMKKLP